MLFTLGPLLASAEPQEAEMAGAWIDLPRAVHAGTLDEETKDLLERYHAVPKDTAQGAETRIELLGAFAQKVAQGPSKREKNLAAHAARKAQYLTRILEVHARHGSLMTFPRVLDEDEGQSVDNAHLPLVNRMMYDTQLPAYWGLFQLEVLDPCHRLLLTESYLKWRETGVETPFFLWLEAHGTFSFKELQVTYLNQEALAQAKVMCVFGTLQDASGVTLSTQEGTEYLYILTRQKELFVVRGDETIRHTSLSLGTSVLGAGSLTAQDGILTYIDTESGHYFPTAQNLMMTLRTLENQGLFINWHTLQVAYHEAGIKHSIGAFDFRRTYEEGEKERKG